jgi:AraC-like DNA-binding protein
MVEARLAKIENWIELAMQAGWSARTLARRLNVSLRTLERYFLKTHGKPLRAWLICARLRYGIRLLTQGRSVKETAFYLGYSCPANFTRAFKRYMGISPARFVIRQTQEYAGHWPQ